MQETHRHGDLVTEDYIEHGVARLVRPVTPEPFTAPPSDDRLLVKLEAVEEQLQLLRLRSEERHAELLAHIDERTAPIQVAPQRRRRA